MLEAGSGEPAAPAPATAPSKTLGWHRDWALAAAGFPRYAGCLVWVRGAVRWLDGGDRETLRFTVIQWLGPCWPPADPGFRIDIPVFQQSLSSACQQMRLFPAAQQGLSQHWCFLSIFPFFRSQAMAGSEGDFIALHPHLA